MGFRCLSTSEPKPERPTSVWKLRTTAKRSWMYLSSVVESQWILFALSPAALSLNEKW
jgi:hypothetical protein